MEGSEEGFRPNRKRERGCGGEERKREKEEIRKREKKRRKSCNFFNKG